MVEAGEKNPALEVGFAVVDPHRDLGRVVHWRDAPADQVIVAIAIEVGHMLDGVVRGRRGDRHRLGREAAAARARMVAELPARGIAIAPACHHQVVLAVTIEIGVDQRIGAAIQRQPGLLGERRFATAHPVVDLDHAAAGRREGVIRPERNQGPVEDGGEQGLARGDREAVHPATLQVRKGVRERKRGDHP